MKKRFFKDAASSSSCCSSCFTPSGTRVASRRRSMRVVRFGPIRRSEGGGGVEAIALPLGMSFAAVVAQVLERKDVAGDTMSIDHLSRVCTSAVRESLTNVFGDKFDYFARNFEKSFGSTLRTLRLINESSTSKGPYPLNNPGLSTSDVTSNEVGSTSPCGVNYCHSETELPTIETQDVLSAAEEVQEQIATNFISKELALHGENNQLACASAGRLGSVINQNMHSTMEKSVVEQIRSNDLKTLELSLAMQKLKLKETQLALNLDSNNLERSKLAMGMSKASFKAEKFKNQLEDMRHDELLKKCIDCLVAGIVIMSASLSYAAYVYSYRKISEATAACTPSPQAAKSWWIPNTFSSFNSGLNTLKCQFLVMSRRIFGFVMIFAIAYLLLQRGATSRHSMPITFILLLLGVVCGFAGKFCVDTLGGSGYLWLLHWETLCLLHFFSNSCTSHLFHVLHGPVNVSQGAKRKAMIPYWVRRSLFYSTLLFIIPLVCGLMPFASPSEWKEHFSLLVLDYQLSMHD